MLLNVRYMTDEFNLDVTPPLKINAAYMKRINEIQGNKSLNKKKEQSPSCEVYKCKHAWQSIAE